MQKRAVFWIFWEQSGQAGVENRGMLTIYLFRYTSECTISQSNFQNFLRLRRQAGIDSPNQNYADVPDRVKRNHRCVTLMTGTARHRLWHLLTSALDAAITGIWALLLLHLDISSTDKRRKVWIPLTRSVVDLSNREQKCAENHNKWHSNFFVLNCNQHFGNYKP